MIGAGPIGALVTRSVPRSSSKELPLISLQRPQGTWSVVRRRFRAYFHSSENRSGLRSRRRLQPSRDGCRCCCAESDEWWRRYRDRLRWEPKDFRCGDGCDKGKGKDRDGGAVGEASQHRPSSAFSSLFSLARLLKVLVLPAGSHFYGEDVNLHLAAVPSFLADALSIQGSLRAAASIRKT